MKLKQEGEMYAFIQETLRETFEGCSPMVIRNALKWKNLGERTKRPKKKNE